MLAEQLVFYILYSYYSMYYKFIRSCKVIYLPTHVTYTLRSTTFNHYIHVQVGFEGQKRAQSILHKCRTRFRLLLQERTSFFIDQDRLSFSRHFLKHCHLLPLNRYRVPYINI